MWDMRLDHLSYAAGPDGLTATVQRLEAELGAEFVDGGFHPRFGTRNQVLPMTDGHYLEVVEVLDHPAADKAPFGRAVRARSLAGGGWLAWVVSTDDLAPIEQRLGRTATEGHRYRPDGVLLKWDQLGVLDLLEDRQLPFFVRWQSEHEVHPSAGGSAVELLAVEIAGEHDRVDEWLGGQAQQVLSDVAVTWNETDGGEPGLLSATFSTPRGEVTL